MSKKNHYILTDEELPMVKLFQQLTLEQCKELFKKNYNNYSLALKCKLYGVIAAKYVWEDEYVPNLKRNNNSEK